MMIWAWSCLRCIRVLQELKREWISGFEGGFLSGFGILLMELLQFTSTLCIQARIKGLFGQVGQMYFYKY